MGQWFHEGVGVVKHYFTNFHACFWFRGVVAYVYEVVDVFLPKKKNREGIRRLGLFISRTSCILRSWKKDWTKNGLGNFMVESLLCWLCPQCRCGIPATGLDHITPMDGDMVLIKLAEGEVFEEFVKDYKDLLETWFYNIRH